MILGVVLPCLHLLYRSGFLVKDWDDSDTCSFAGVYLHVTVSAKDMGEGPVLESPVFHPPPCYHSGNNLLYSNSCMVSLKRAQEHSKLLVH